MKKATIKSVTAYKLIRDGIFSGEFLPGTRLVLAELEKKLGLGRGPVRDALMRLDRSGLVENIPFKGAMVKAPPSIQELEYIYQTRMTIEKRVIVASMNKATAQQLASLQKLVNASLKDIDIPHKFFAHDRKFHAALYKIADLPHALDVISNLNEHIDIFLNTHRYDYSYRSESIRHHQEMLDAIREKREDMLVAVLEKNMAIGLEYIQKNLLTPGEIEGEL